MSLEEGGGGGPDPIHQEEEGEEEGEAAEVGLFRLQDREVGGGGGEEGIPQDLRVEGGRGGGTVQGIHYFYDDLSAFGKIPF